MPEWKPSQPVSIRLINKPMLARALCEVAHSKGTKGNPTRFIWNEEAVKNAYFFADLCGVTINCDLSGNSLDPKGYTNLYGPSDEWLA